MKTRHAGIPYSGSSLRREPIHQKSQRRRNKRINMIGSGNPTIILLQCKAIGFQGPTHAILKDHKNPAHCHAAGFEQGWGNLTGSNMRGLFVLD